MISIKGLIEEAECLLPATTEARFRTVMSRSYYAAFHACAGPASSAGYVFEKGSGGTHSQLLAFLKTHPRLRRIGKRLQTLYDLRLGADYRLGNPASSALAEEAVDGMGEVVAMIEAINFLTP